MPCYSCVDKLAYKLMAHHKIDMIRAYELAEKGVERTEHRAVEPQIFSGTGNPSDYSQTCNNCGKYCDCYNVEVCVVSTDCREVLTCSGLGCCPDPLPNSHQVSNGCVNVSPSYHCSCKTQVCSGSCSCFASGSCTYDCDTGYVWNPVTLACELPTVAEKTLGDGIVFATA